MCKKLETHADNSKTRIWYVQKTGNTCGQFKNRNLVCAKKLETHADNSKTRIWYVRKSKKHMRIIQKLELGMCEKARNTCGQFKNRN